MLVVDGFVNSGGPEYDFNRNKEVSTAIPNLAGRNYNFANFIVQISVYRIFRFLARNFWFRYDFDVFLFLLFLVHVICRYFTALELSENNCCNFSLITGFAKRFL
ncbi:MAG TPA: hypothetical protein DCZ40_14920 [Lachnospiraceae bacterium]|nr:hypothetical protein [Lachnospiraceae bacterium]